MLTMTAPDRIGVADRYRYEDLQALGIRESLMVSVAGGLALTGLRSLIHTYAPFLAERSFEQIKLDLTHQGVSAVLVSVGASYDWTEGGRTHQSPGPALDGQLSLVRRGERALVLAVGPMLDPVLAATTGLDVTVAYTNMVRPLDLDGLRDLATADTVILVEPYLAGTSTRLIDQVLPDRPHRTLALGVGRAEQRRYGTPKQHDVLHGLDAAGLRHSISKFLPGS
jgi:transketolase